MSDCIGLPQEVQPLLSHVASDAADKARTEEGLTPDNFVRQIQLGTDDLYLIILDDVKVVVEGISIAVEKGFQEGAAPCAKKATTSSPWPSEKAWTRTRAPSPLLRTQPE